MFDFLGYAETHSPLATVIVLMAVALVFCVVIILRIQFNRIKTKLDEVETKLNQIHEDIDRVSQVEDIITKNVKDPNSDDGAIYHRHLLQGVNDLKKVVCSENCPALKIVDTNLTTAIHDIKELMRRILERITQLEKDMDTLHARIDNWTGKILEFAQRVNWRDRRE